METERGKMKGVSTTGDCKGVMWLWNELRALMGKPEVMSKDVMRLVLDWHISGKKQCGKH
jgi:hypothetical protein